MSYYRTSTIKDALYVAKNIRAEDKREIEGLGYNLAILPWSVINSPSTVTFFDKDHPDEIMGVAGIMPDEDNPNAGIVWMLCTPHVANRPHTFIRQAKRWLEREGKPFDYLLNLADARNHLHHKFLKLLGFKALKVVHPAPYYIPYLEIIKLCAPRQQSPLPHSQ